MKTKNLTFCISKELVEELDSYSKKSMIPKSKLVSKLLKEYFLKLKKNGKSNNK